MPFLAILGPPGYWCVIGAGCVPTGTVLSCRKPHPDAHTLPAPALDPPALDRFGGLRAPKFKGRSLSLQVS